VGRDSGSGVRRGPLHHFDSPRQKGTVGRSAPVPSSLPTEVAVTTGEARCYPRWMASSGMGGCILMAGTAPCSRELVPWL